MIRLRVDVDYAYAARLKSVCHVLTGVPVCSDYLANAKVIAGLVNSSCVDVVVYWFFNYRVLPDRELLSLIGGKRHVWGLHLVNDVEKERAIVEGCLGRKVRFCTVHGTSSFFGQVLWGRRLGVTRVMVSDDLVAFDAELTHCLDVSCFRFDAVDAAARALGCGAVVSFHPEWLFRGNGVDRGSFFDALRLVLGFVG